MSNFLNELIYEQKLFTLSQKNKINLSENKKLRKNKQKNNFKYLIMHSNRLIPKNKQLINLKMKHNSFNDSKKHFKLNVSDLNNLTKINNVSLNTPKNQKKSFLDINKNINNSTNNNITYFFHNKENTKSLNIFPTINKKKQISLNFHFNGNLFFSPNKFENNNNIFYNTSMKIMKINSPYSEKNSNKNFKTLIEKDKKIFSFNNLNNDYDKNHMKTLSMRDIMKKKQNKSNNINDNKNKLKIPLQNLFIKDKIKKYYVNSETQTEENNLLFTHKNLNSDGHRNIIVKIRNITKLKNK